MAGKGIITAIFAVLLTAGVSWAFSAGPGGGGFGVTTMDMLMPSPPTNVTAIAGNGEATVSFTPPKSDGGSPITRYTVTSHPGRIKAVGKQSPITVKGLTNGRTYTFTVDASNSVGTGLDSEACNSVTPRAERETDSKR
ncbi:MAG: fibronectin type III domain-containing protein [Syntrophobacteraceae bacterium]|jgi:hypothetical protein